MATEPRYRISDSHTPTMVVLERRGWIFWRLVEYVHGNDHDAAVRRAVMVAKNDAKRVRIEVRA